MRLPKNILLKIKKNADDEIKLKISEEKRVSLRLVQMVFKGDRRDLHGIWVRAAELIKEKQKKEAEAAKRLQSITDDIN